MLRKGREALVSAKENRSVNTSQPEKARADLQVFLKDRFGSMGEAFQLMSFHGGEHISCHQFQEIIHAQEKYCDAKSALKLFLLLARGKRGRLSWQDFCDGLRCEGEDLSTTPHCDSAYSPSEKTSMVPDQSPPEQMRKVDKKRGTPARSAHVGDLAGATPSTSASSRSPPLSGTPESCDSFCQTALPADCSTSQEAIEVELDFSHSLLADEVCDHSVPAMVATESLGIPASEYAMTTQTHQFGVSSNLLEWSPSRDCDETDAVLTTSLQPRSCSPLSIGSSRARSCSPRDEADSLHELSRQPASPRQLAKSSTEDWTPARDRYSDNHSTTEWSPPRDSYADFSLRRNSRSGSCSPLSIGTLSSCSNSPRDKSDLGISYTDLMPDTESQIDLMATEVKRKLAEQIATAEYQVASSSCEASDTKPCPNLGAHIPLTDSQLQELSTAGSLSDLVCGTQYKLVQDPLPICSADSTEASQIEPCPVTLELAAHLSRTDSPLLEVRKTNSRSEFVAETEQWKMCSSGIIYNGGGVHDLVPTLQARSTNTTTPNSGASSLEECSYRELAWKLMVWKLIQSAAAPEDDVVPVGKQGADSSGDHTQHDEGLGDYMLAVPYSAFGVIEHLVRQVWDYSAEEKPPIMNEAQGCNTPARDKESSVDTTNSLGLPPLDLKGLEEPKASQTKCCRVCT